MSFPHDVEGVPSRPISVIKNGILQSYFHTSYSAGEKPGGASNGHARRQSYLSPIYPGIGNLQFSPGATFSNEIIGKIKSGIYLTSLPKPDARTGKINSSLKRAFHIADGQLGAAVENAILVGDFLNMLAQIETVSKDFENMSGFILPYILIQDAQIISC